PTPDHGDDVLDPLGAKFTLPMPFLWQHGKGTIKDPIGWITAAAPGKEGIPIKGRVARIDEPQSLKDDIDRAWWLMKSGLVRGRSVGWQPIDAKPRGNNFGVHATTWNWHELSAVAIPMNSEATIISIKSADEPFLRAASGEPAGRKVVRLKPSPGAAGNAIMKGKPVKMTYKEHIAAMEASRQAKAARMDTLMKDVADKGETLDEAGAQEFDGLKTEIETIDKDLVRYRELDRINAEKAVVIQPAAATEPAAATSARAGVISVKSNLPKGTHFTRMCMAIGAGRGDYRRTMEHAKQWHDTPEVETMVKAAVAPGTTTDATWAGPLVVARPLVEEFLDLLRPGTLSGPR